MSDSGERDAGTTAQATPTPDIGHESAEPTPPPRQARGWSRRTWTLVFSSAVVIVLVLVGAFVPVPYVALGPGPTYDTLSSVQGTPVVAVAGTRTYPTDGQLRMVTVSLTNGTTLFAALGMWMSGKYALAPREDYYQPGESEQQVEQQNVQEFKDSQSDAEVSALRFLHYPINAVAQQVVSGTPADGRIHAGDKLVRVNGSTPNSAQGVQ
ncbi:MAG TPA: PDZ domain-containing protein, partial [Pseudonocardiaceae bacterium]|nr:PDZ domain-containing protein [Pseudonocardiaceae bacterium]